MSELVWLVPVLARPHRVRPLLEAIEATTPSARVLFLADPDDAAECAAIRRERARRALRVDAIACGGNYAEKINAGIRATGEPLIFFGADDLRPYPGWLAAAKERLQSPVGVVGVNDLIERKRTHATHFLVTREYAESETVDGATGPLHEGYRHWWVDDELIATARSRGAYAYARRAVVEHIHPQAGKAPDDDTYRRGREHRRSDRRLFLRRTHLWTST